MSDFLSGSVGVTSDDPEERSMAALGHGSIVLNLFVPGLGIVAAAAVWLTQRERSRYAAWQALQATVYQICLALLPIILTIAGTVIVGAAIFLAVVTDSSIMLAVIPIIIIGSLLMSLLLLVGFFYGLVGAYQTYQGRDFRYWIVGKMLDRK